MYLLIQAIHYSASPFVMQLVFLLVGVTPVFVAQTFYHHHPAIPGVGNTSHLASTPNAPPASLAAPGLSGSPPSGGLPAHLLYVLLSGLVASRFGLWLFDLAVTQLQQELVPDTELGEPGMPPLVQRDCSAAVGS